MDTLPRPYDRIMAAAISTIVVCLTIAAIGYATYEHGFLFAALLFALVMIVSIIGAVLGFWLGLNVFA